MMALCIEMIIENHQELIMDNRSWKRNDCRLLMHWQISVIIIRRLLNESKTPHHGIEFQW